jgi:hypothetical protein
MPKLSRAFAVGLSLPVLLACRPVIAIGWPELLILLVLLGILFGPPLFRLYTWLQKYRSEQHDKEKRKK